MKFTFLFNSGKYDSWRSYKDEDEGTENAVVLVNEAIGGFHLECDQYYGLGGTCRLTITQHLDRALATYAAVLAADHAQEELDCMRFAATQKAETGS